MRIPVVFATDKNYVFYTCVAIESLAQNAAPGTQYQIYVLTGLAPLDESLFESLKQKYSYIQIKIIRIEEERFGKVIINNTHVTKTTFYRLLLSNLLEEKKCIYLDSDIVVTEDLQKLFSVDITGYYIAGCRDVWIDMLSEEECEKRRRRTNIPSMQKYVNAGVLLINLEKIKKDSLEKEFYKHLSIDYLYEDQDIINVCCYGKIKYLPAKWNIFTLFLGSLDEMRAKGISEDVLHEFSDKKGIIHYATPFIRPWEHFHCWANQEWWEIAAEWKETSYYQKLEKKVRKREETGRWIYYLKKCKAYQKIIIFGFTIYGKQVCDWLLNSGFMEKLIFCDNNPEKLQQIYKGIHVISLEEAKRKGVLFINTSQNRREEVSELLIEAGIKKENLICYIHKNKEYYRYLDSRYYLEELKDIFLRECGSGLNGFKDDFSEIKKSLRERPEYQNWSEKYFMKEWILKEI